MHAMILNRFNIEGIPFYRVVEHSTGEIFVVNARFVGGDETTMPAGGWSGPASVRDGNSTYVARHATTPQY